VLLSCFFEDSFVAMGSVWFCTEGTLIEFHIVVRLIVFSMCNLFSVERIKFYFANS
jgi:hypothetical protein